MPTLVMPGFGAKTLAKDATATLSPAACHLNPDLTHCNMMLETKALGRSLLVLQQALRSPSISSRGYSTGQVGLGVTHSALASPSSFPFLTSLLLPAGGHHS